MTKTKYLVYGTLREEIIRGRYGDKWADSIKVINPKVEIPGVALKDYGYYPIAQMSDDPEDKTLCELIEINDPQVEQRICMMELGAGYEKVTMNGATIFLHPQSRDLSAYDTVKSGDWCEFYLREQKRKI